MQDPDAVTAGGGGVEVIFDQALSPNLAGLVLLIATIGQFFCTTACLTSHQPDALRVQPRRRRPGSRYWCKLDTNKAAERSARSGDRRPHPHAAGAVEVNIGTAEEPIIVTAFFAVVSIGVLGLYLAFAIPIYLRLEGGYVFTQGSWNLGNKWKWMAPVAIVEILITSVYFILPFTPAAIP